MSNESNKNKPTTHERPQEAEPGRGAPGNHHYAVQTAQTTAVNPKDERIPSGASAEDSRKELEQYKKQEEGTGVDTAAGFGVTESGQLTNVAIEPEMRVEE